MANISYNPNDAGSIVSAVMEKIYDQTKSFNKDKKAPSKDPIATFKKIAKKLGPDVDPIKRRNANRIFLEGRVPVFLFFVSNSGRLKDYKKEKTSAIRAYIEKYLSNLKDPAEYIALRKLILQKTTDVFDEMAEQGYRLITKKVPAEEYMELINKVEDLEEENKTLKTEVKKLKAELKKATTDKPSAPKKKKSSDKK